jgi:hypothetical protein
MYATNENGDLASAEILRKAIELAGFDGIIDNNVYNKFGKGKEYGTAMDGIYPDTQHVITFDSNQSKSTENETFCGKTGNIYKDFAEMLDVKAGFNPNQQRSSDGTWGSENLTDEDQEIIDHYTDDGFTNMNRSLRSNGYFGEDPDILAKKVADLKVALNKLPNFEGTVYRGIDFGGVGSKVWGFNSKINNFKEITFKAFLSSSKDSGFPNDILSGGRSGGKYLIEIISKTGKDIGDYAHSKGESEVIFQPQTIFEILDFDLKSNPMIIKLKEK